MWSRLRVLQALGLLVLLVPLLAACTQTDASSTSGTPTTGSAGAGGGTVTSQATAAPVSDGGNFEQCRDCHADLDYTASRNGVLLPAFKHQFHLDAGAKCGQCHQTPTHTKQGIRKPTMAKCFGCHSQNDAAAPPGACDACHPADFPLKPGTHADPDWLPPANRLDAVKAKHSVAAAESPQECSVCHAQSFCEGCHKVSMPHPADWQAAHPETARKVGGQTCDRCHPQKTLCNSCHHKGFDPAAGTWRQQHRNIVATAGAQPCFSCHSSTTCAHCHTTGEYKAF